MRKPSTNRDSKYLLGGNLLVAFMGIYSQFLILDNLSSYDYAIWVLLLDASLTVGTLADFGIPDAMIRSWSGKKRHIKSVVKTGFISQFSLAFTVLLLSIPISGLIQYDEVPSSTIYFMIIGSLILFLLGSLRIGLRMMGRADEESLALVVDRMLYISALLYVLNIGPNIRNIALAFLAAATLSLLYTAWRYVSISNRIIGFSYSEKKATQSNVLDMIKRSLPFALSLFLFPLFGRIDKFLIAGFIGVLEVAYYNIPWLVILTGFSVPRSIRQASLPHLAVHKNKLSKMSDVFERSWPLVISLIWIGVPSCILISDFVFQKIFPARLVSPPGISFSGGRLLVCILPAWVWSMVGAIDLEVTKLEKNSLKYTGSITLALLINLLFGYLIIPELELLGAALSSTIGFASLFLVSYKLGPFSGIKNKLAFEKFIYGSYFTLVLFFVALSWDSNLIGSSSINAALIIAIATLPMFFWNLRSRLVYFDYSWKNLTNNILGDGEE